MDPIYIFGIVTVLLVGIAVGVLFAIPKTRPYIQKWWPVAVVIAGTILIALLFRRKPAEYNGIETGTLDRTVADAQGQLIEAQIIAETTETAADTTEGSVRTELTNINQISDPYERVAAKKRLLNRVRGR